MEGLASHFLELVSKFTKDIEIVIRGYSRRSSQKRNSQVALPLGAYQTPSSSFVKIYPQDLYTRKQLLVIEFIRLWRSAEELTYVLARCSPDK